MLEVEYAEKIIARLQHDWSKTKGKSFPLGLADQQQWQWEMSVQQCFWKLSDVLTKGKQNSKSDKSDNVKSKLWPLWTYDDVVGDKKMFTLMSETGMNEAVSDIWDMVHCPLAISIDGTTVLSLSDKTQEYEDSGHVTCFDNAAIAVSPQKNITNHLFIGKNTSVAATFYVGYTCEYDDDGEVCGGARTPGFLVCKNKAMKDYAVILSEFSALVEIVEDKEYLFTHYSDGGEELFIKHLTSLDNVVDLFSGSDI